MFGLYGFIYVSLLFVYQSSNMPYEPVRSDLALTISSEAEVWELGQSFSVRLSFTNTSKEPYFINFSAANYGPENLNLIARKDKCEYTVYPRHFDRSVEDLRYDYVPLQPGDSFQTSIAISGYQGADLISLDLHQSGIYHLAVNYASLGPEAEGKILPIWKGRVISNEIRINVKQPPTQTVNRFIRRLEQCASGKCSDYDPIWYFGIVRTRDQAERVLSLLSRMLEREPDGPSSVPIAQAIANQMRKQDIVFFRKLAVQYKVRPTMVEFYNKLAQIIANADSCD